MLDQETLRFEYEQLMLSYHHYFALVAKGIAIYLLIIGACLSLPYTLKFDTSQQLAVFKEMCRMFAVIVSIGGVTGYAVASKTFWDLHKRAKNIASNLEIQDPNTWVMPFIVWLACGVAAILVVMIMKYA